MERTQDSLPPEGERKLRSREALGSVDGALQQPSGDKHMVPLANGSGSRESLVELERQQQRGTDGPKRFSSTILALQEERDKVLQQFQDDGQRKVKQNLLSSTMLRDLDEMGKALAQSRQAAKQAKRQLAQKEAEVEQLVREKRAVLELIIEVGPWAVWDWIRNEIVEEGLEPDADFERRWIAWLAAIENVTGNLGEDNAAAAAGGGDNFAEKRQSSNEHEPKHTTSSGPDNLGKTSLLRILVSIVLQEGMENLEIVLKKGPFFLPMAWLYFWMGLYSRITWHVVGVVSSSLRRSLFPFTFHVI